MSAKQVLVDESNLCSVFLKGQELFERIENTTKNTSDSSVQNEIKYALQIFEECHKVVRSESIFSSNDTAQDLEADQLQYILLHFYSGILTQKLVSNEILRINLLKQTDAFFEAFITSCEKLEILTEKEKINYREPDQSVDPQTRRQRKIERFQQEKADKQRLEHVIQLQKLAAESGRIDEELKREHIFLLLHSCIRRSFDEISCIAQELKMYQQMAEFREKNMRDGICSETDLRQKPVEKQQSKGITVTHIGKNMEMRKETIRAQVFEPGYNLPTKTLKELADEEMQQAKERQKAQESAPKPVRKYKDLEEEGDEDINELVDQATLKDRSWDDWKDENPKGIGNKGTSQF